MLTSDTYDTYDTHDTESQDDTYDTYDTESQDDTHDTYDTESQDDTYDTYDAYDTCDTLRHHDTLWHDTRVIHIRHQLFSNNTRYINKWWGHITRSFICSSVIRVSCFKIWHVFFQRWHIIKKTLWRVVACQSTHRTPSDACQSVSSCDPRMLPKKQPFGSGVLSLEFTCHDTCHDMETRKHLRSADCLGKYTVIVLSLSFEAASSCKEWIIHSTYLINSLHTAQEGQTEKEVPLPSFSEQFCEGCMEWVLRNELVTCVWALSNMYLFSNTYKMWSIPTFT